MIIKIRLLLNYNQLTTMMTKKKTMTPMKLVKSNYMYISFLYNLFYFYFFFSVAAEQRAIEDAYFGETLDVELAALDASESHDAAGIIVFFYIKKILIFFFFFL